MSAINEHGLTPQQECFAQEVARGKPLAQAYRIAYPKSLKWKNETLWPAASQLMAHPKVHARVEALQKAAAAEVVVEKSALLRELMRLAFADPRRLAGEDGKVKPLHKLDDDMAAAVASVKVGADGKVEYKLWDKGAAQEKLAKHLGLYEKDNRQHADPLAELARALLGNTVGPAGLALGDGGQ
ncbi:MAG: terminase small subunit [Burkholderiaceae bacterium]|jgi:phage terminase small subunit|nr:terminase small subunit [Burkholderiaceae bacterium]